MGWDAYAEPVERAWGLDKKPASPEWVSAVDRVVTATGAVDGLLKNGGLDCGICGEMLCCALGLPKSAVYTEGWTVEEVKHFALTANWNFDVSLGDRWAKESAKAFLETCAEHGKSITFSF